MTGETVIYGLVYTQETFSIVAFLVGIARQTDGQTHTHEHKRNTFLQEPKKCT